ncbi:RNA polymerase sigma-70 factor [Arcticibacter tournemirensis]
MPIHSGLSDHQLVFLLKEGNQPAMTAIFERYWERLFAVALNRLDSQEEAEECVQDVFINLWRLRETLDLKYSLYTYLSAAVRYRVLDLLDARYRQSQHAPDVLSYLLENNSTVLSPESSLLEKELLDHIEAIVERLPEKCRIVYRLSREEGKSHKEISAELNISQKTVEAHLTRAIKDIKGNLPAYIPGFVIWFFFL